MALKLYDFFQDSAMKPLRTESRPIFILNETFVKILNELISYNRHLPHFKAHFNTNNIIDTGTLYYDNIRRPRKKVALSSGGQFFGQSEIDWRVGHQTDDHTRVK
jgi:hypothetical protein